MSKEFSEYINMIIRNIFSGKNSCGTLISAVENNETNYFYNAIAPVIEVIEQEKEFITKQRNTALAELERKRFALETIASNLYGFNLVKTCEEAIRHGLPGKEL